MKRVFIVNHRGKRFQFLSWNSNRRRSYDFKYVEGVFETRELAVSHIKSKGFVSPEYGTRDGHHKWYHLYSENTMTIDERTVKSGE